MHMSIFHIFYFFILFSSFSHPKNFDVTKLKYVMILKLESEQYSITFVLTSSPPSNSNYITNAIADIE